MTKERRYMRSDRKLAHQNTHHKVHPQLSKLESQSSPKLLNIQKKKDNFIY